MPYDETFEHLFKTEYARLFRYLDRLSGEPDLAADLVQEAFIRLYRRGTMPDRPQLWLVTVALNLFRNARSTRSRRLRLLSRWTEAAEPAEPDTGASSENSTTVRAALDRLPPRERELLLLRAEGYSYREMAEALELKEASVGTLLARAKRAFRLVYEGGDAPGR